MKKRFMKKALAVVMSAAMAFSMVSAAEIKTASAATNFVSLKTTFKTLKVGQTYKLTLKNNNINWKIQKVTTSDKLIAAVYGKTSSYVMLKGKSEGRAKIKVFLKTARRKTNNTKTLTCKANVVAAAVDPGTAAPPAETETLPGTQDPVQTTATAATQEELNAALNNTAVTSITIKTDAESTFTIPSGQNRNVDLTVDAPNAEVENNAVFKTVTIKAVKDSSWTEKASGNSLKVDAAKARIVIDAAASVTGITITNADADIVIVADGTLADVTISAKAKVSITGKTTTKVPVALASAAADTDLTAAVPVTLTTAVNANVTLQAGAEDSTVQITNSAAKVYLKNSTTKTVTVTKADNTNVNVGVNRNLTIQGTTGSTGTGTGTGTGSGSWYGGGSTGSGSTGGSSSVSKTTATVSTQAQLDSALSDNRVGTIMIEGAEGDLTVGSRSQINTYSKSLIVNSPKATIHNYGEFNSIRIDAISENTWYEHAGQNSLNVLAVNPHIVIVNALRGLTFGSGVGNPKLDINGTLNGSVTCSASAGEGIELEINVNSKNAFGSGSMVNVSRNMHVTIQAGSDADLTDTKIPVQVTGENASVTSNVPASIRVEQGMDVQVTLNSGAEGSSITSAADTTIKVTNTTSTEVAVSVNGETETVGANTTVDITVEASGEITAGEPASTGGETQSTGGESASTGDETTGSYAAEGVQVQIGDPDLQYQESTNVTVIIVNVGGISVNGADAEQASSYSAGSVVSPSSLKVTTQAAAESGKNAYRIMMSESEATLFKDKEFIFTYDVTTASGEYTVTVRVGSLQPTGNVTEITVTKKSSSQS